ncbi:PepSY-associated TM helix domain-containing protein [Olivibacter ginsenosidimutans]|uniref:PepSY-associated TM helix domain-containing protein n=1 Tax=Olivibacter ginsenosidimutans TaxID=1176537 RepID=A0ABP9C859_9SPHI
MGKEKSLATVPPKKVGKSWLSRAIAWIHLWPSLVSAIILIVVCITGTVVVYCDEIMEWSAGDARYVEQVGKERMPVELIMERLKKEFPNYGNPSYMVAYKDPKRSVRFNMFSRKVGLRMVYVDPYTGEILKNDATIYFFYITAHLHASLLWGKTGMWIVDIATIIFLIELITGLVLWWPAKWTKATRDASFKVKWKARFERLNYDLHNVIGFYALSICLVLTLSGLIIAFKPLAQFTIQAAGGDASHHWEEQLPAADQGKVPAAINHTLDQFFAAYPEAKEAQVNTFKLDQNGWYGLRLARAIGLKSADNAKAFFIDRYSGRSIEVPEAAMKHEQVENIYWSLHMGTWMGPIGKLCTFIGGLVSTSLPITGFIIWWGRRKKGKKRKGSKESLAEERSMGSYKPRHLVKANS